MIKYLHLLLATTGLLERITEARGLAVLLLHLAIDLLDKQIPRRGLARLAAAGTTLRGRLHRGDYRHYNRHAAAALGTFTGIGHFYLRNRKSTRHSFRL